MQLIMGTANSELSHLGEIFRGKRVEKNLSLKEVENATSIRSHYISAIEEGQLAKLISPVYAQGFMKRYAAFLDLDGESLLRQHPAVMRILAQNKLEQEEATAGFPAIEARTPPPHHAQAPGLPAYFWIGLSVLVIASFWLLGRYLGLI